ncbi:leucyl aminopeptidase [Sphingobium wenxiniae]|uniref:Probable cytosol aminopeptidase n=2 Tax=Sphingobium TaxID=165695 RepID=T0HN93_9SPHN|nr:MULTISPECIES: leucyl aminopeptidase [Sphingobium]EQA99038.1 leucyl aminopeptidase [Sphingobium baderi LL03]KMS61506.1 leucyl aminopeptidase [Sphingobium baderi LL03]MBB6191785.1 leucyl aminopeptidase [Sphingobium wenxiniae]TWH96819.1 leucyl aminopeptidase [Sphingobium wenxiniae]WRD75198.1 leucyl aminopeptidase [Sphingobium baderi]
MDIAFSPSRPDADTLVFAVAKGAVETLPLSASPTLTAGASAARFAGEAGTSFESFVEEGGKVLRVVLLGIGGGGDADLERAGGALTARLATSGAVHAAVEFPAGGAGKDAARLAFGALLRGWRIETYRTRQPEKAKPTLKTVTVVSADAGAEWDRLSAVAAGVAFTRELVAEPANILYPESFVERCQPLREMGVRITVLDKAAMAELGMGALLGVAQGSMREPRLLALEWDGTDGAQKKPVVFVGKGVTFDTGGISLKPGPGMEDMKWDMGGAGAVAGAMKALAGRKAKAHVVGICGLVENMPDGGAQRPGDIVTSMSGQTIEVLNTDAEGRLVLCDALTWAQKSYDPEILVDLATLTGAMIVSLGSEYAGVFSNDDGLADDLIAAGKAAGDPLWRFPLGDAYDKLLESPIADIKNIGPRFAGSITAAQFIKRFVNDGVKWAHLDIAGMVWADKPGAVWDKGATGYGVRLIDRFVADTFES